MEQTNARKKILSLVVASAMATTLSVPAAAWADVEGEGTTPPPHGGIDR